MPAPAYNDGNIPYGSVKITVGGTLMVAEEVDFEDTVHTVDRRNEVGIPNGAVYIPQKVTGKLVLQLPSSATAVPNVGDIGSFTYRGVPKNFIFTRIGQPLRQLDILKLQVEFAEKLN